MSQFDELFNPGGIDSRFLSLALAIGSKIAAYVRALVECDSHPPQGLDNLVLTTRHEPFSIGVLDSEDVCSAVVARIQVIEQHGAQRANVEQPGWARSEADSDGHCL